MYTEIFHEIIDIMHNDYAGYIDKKGWDNPEEYGKRIEELENEGNLTADTFAEIIRDYMLDFKDKHMIFKALKFKTEKQYDNGFKVRRYEDKLFIVSVGMETQLVPGDAIVELNNFPVLELVEKNKRELMETKAERESWSNIINKYNYAKVINSEGEQKVIELKKHKKERYIPEHSVTRIDSNTIFMKLTDFFSPDPINELIKKHQEELSSTENLIIDVRVNNGGSDASFHNLAPFLFPVQTTIVDYSDYKMKFNCTDRNATLQINSLKDELSQVNDPTIQEMIKQFTDIWEKHRGKGFVTFELQDTKVEIMGAQFPKNIIVLTDVYCGSAGDIFVSLCKQSPKVTVVGRATMGVNDYANLTSIRWDNQFELMYPTSRLDQLDHRGTLDEPGIKPHIYIPWTPEHLKKDVDMEAAMKLLQETTRK